jgi:cyclopropane fatty-acyl-phospholipid synthase-like methyltransferase
MPVRLSLRERVLFLLNRLPVPIFDAFAAVLLGKALIVCNSYGVFEVLHGSGHLPAELGKKVGLSTQGVEILLRTLEAGGYVRRSGNQYWNSRLADRWLTRKSPYYLGNLVQYFDSLFSRLDHLAETAQRGEPVKPYFEYFKEKDWETYTYGMMDLARLLMPEVLRVIQLPRTARRLLDIGGSHGLFSIELCRIHPGLTADVFDLHEVSKVGERITRDFQMSSRVVHRSGDFMKDNFGSGYDIVLAFNVIHGLKRSENSSLMRKISEALDAEGTLFIMDQVISRTNSGSLSHVIPAAVGLNLFNEIGGNAYTFSEIRGWCAEAGLVDCSFKKLRVPGVAIIQTRKP